MPAGWLDKGRVMSKAISEKFRGAGRIAFLARIDVIREMVFAGYPLLAIYRQYEEWLGVVSYSQFARYVARYVRNAVDQGKVEQPLSAAASRSPAKADEQPCAESRSVEGRSPTLNKVHPTRPPIYDAQGSKRDDLI